ncbi:vacuolar-sorting protein SNF8 isoform X4 [Heterocephalus glaber]|uniref:Vacuolar-sorting protein SNF8 n=1 Tax=Heterocephalus glaber TaxID=10181 RepID=A0AAX6RIC9_HETGA|nr:vacuolar-sorting protein SNF8 isoform X4 [Heterocephalus glaber]
MRNPGLPGWEPGPKRDAASGGPGGGAGRGPRSGMHRRGVGAGAIAKKKLAEAKYKERGTVLAEDQLTQMSKQLDMFKTNLEEFASKHKQEIRKNPEFRVQFQDMCATIGVDPLASGKGFWSEMLGVGDFYYELGVQVIEVCLALKHRNGGLITLEELHQQVLKGRGKFAQDVSQDDLLRAIKKLKALGSGFGIIPVGGTYLIQSVPAELNMDHTVVLQLAEKNGYVTVSEIRASLKWETERARQVLVGAPAQGGAGLAGPAGRWRGTLLAARALCRPLLTGDHS